MEDRNMLSNIEGKYYISNIDNQIHNVSDKLHNIIKHDDGTVSISLIDEDGCECDYCTLYNTLQDLLVAINCF
jgi:hypothetical protein